VQNLSAGDGKTQNNDSKYSAEETHRHSRPAPDRRIDTQCLEAEKSIQKQISRLARLGGGLRRSRACGSLSTGHLSAEMTF